MASSLYHGGNRRLEVDFQSVAIADRLEEKLAHVAFTRRESGRGPALHRLRKTLVGCGSMAEPPSLAMIRFSRKRWGRR
jgi:hypothetical protein